MRFAGKAAVVTGAARGLGATVARRLAGEGAGVVIADIDGAGAAAVASGIVAGGGRAVPHEMDVTVAADAEAMAGAAVAAFGSLDVLVNNAAVFGAGSHVLDISPEGWDRTMSVNLKGPLLCSQAAIRRMREQTGGGSIVFVSSLSGVVANENQADYNASKHGVIGLARCIAQDCRDWGVRSNVVAPTGMSGTDMMAHTPPANVAPYAAQTAFARLATTEEVASAVLFLASDEASFITGTVLMVDGGVHAMQPSARQLAEGAERFMSRPDRAR
ncbi:MAG: SDR family NAD(P)-dependent oxidoreductase [bacterium]|nr:SDR family NAD(P)-dependent oxidoreductase [bacterium]